jgi:hypothetical protein
MSSLETAQVRDGATTRRGARVWALVLVAVVAVAAAGAAGVLPGPAVWLVASAPFVFLPVRRATVRRLAVRNVARRPQEAVLVLIGALLGTAMITGGLLIQNSLSDSLTSRAATQLGPVDEIVTTPDARSMTQVVSLLTAQPPRGVAGVLPLVTMEGSAYTTGARTYAQPHANLVEVDFANAQRFATSSTTRAATPSHP